MKGSRGFSLLEIIFAMAIFTLILVIAFLPFKMLRDSFKLGGGRIDTQQEVREPLNRLARELRTGTSVKFSPDPGSPGSYRRVNMTSTSLPKLTFSIVRGGETLTVDYQCKAVAYGTSGAVTEWALVRGQQRQGGERETRTVISQGLVTADPATGRPGLYFDLNWNKMMGYSDADWEYPTLLIGATAYPVDAGRPLPDSSKVPIRVGTQVNLTDPTLTPQSL